MDIFIAYLIIENLYSPFFKLDADFSGREEIRGLIL